MNRFFTLLLAASCLTAVGQGETLGDLNSDGLVGIEDLMDLLGVFGVNYNELNAHPDCVPFEYDGYVYDVIQFGNHCWMAENLRTDRLNNGTGEIPTISSLEEWASLLPFAQAQTIYNFDETLFEEHGRLYTYSAAMQACPTGWNLPSDNYAWYLLEHEYADLPIWELGNNSTMNRGVSSASGDQLTSLDYGGTDETGFGAKHSGRVQIGYVFGDTILTASFSGLNEFAWFWTQNPDNIPCQCGAMFSIDGNCTRQTRQLQYGVGNIARFSQDSRQGLSVRCFKQLN